MAETKKEFHIKILGRLLEHLGVQMYKHRDAAIAELVANAWDAGANSIWITLPDEANYNHSTSEILIEDDGCGMNEEDLQDKYLVIGRNRRAAEGTEEFNGRRVMGRKGIGKLAGFGIATNMTIETWIREKSIELTLNLDRLKNNPLTETKEDVEKRLEGIVRDRKPHNIHNSSNSGTRIKLSTLKQKSSLNIEALHISLARRFSRTVQGHMKIFINEAPLKSLQITLHKNSPALETDLTVETLEDTSEVKYSYAFSSNPITRDRSMQGWTILVNGKTAQAPPFFFNVDTNGRSQHSSKYLIGIIEADFLDRGTSDETDIIATDRQEIDWERKETQLLWEWGRKLTQKIFNEIGERNAEDSKNIVLEETEYKARIDLLDEPLQKQCLSFIGSIGKIKIDGDEMPMKEKVLQMADQIIKAFEYRHFVDVIEDIEQASENPENLDLLLTHLEKWDILESRSILEIVKGRIVIVEKLHSLVVNNAPETANRNFGKDNMHDLVAGFPWLLNPEWQILDEERSITKQLQEWGEQDIPDADNRERYDFLAMKSDFKLVIIEIKRSGHPVELEEVQRLERYRERLSRTHKDITCVLLYGGNHNLSDAKLNEIRRSADFKLITWAEIYSENNTYYNHYKAVLQGHLEHPDFFRKQKEVAKVKQVISSGSVYRSKEDRKEGLGPQDVNTKL